MSLAVTRIEDLPGVVGPSDHFTGAVTLQTVAENPAGPSAVSRVTFQRNARTNWHRHGGQQVLYFLVGRGRVQVQGEPAVDTGAGDIVRIPPDTRHWHGAHPDEAQAMTHLAITFGAPRWEDPVDDATYRAPSE
jgi:quercetin dioxygenase-like cupin family protein